MSMVGKFRVAFPVMIVAGAGMMPRSCRRIRCGPWMRSAGWGPLLLAGFNPLRISSAFSEILRIFLPLLLP